MILLVNVCDSLYIELFSSFNLLTGRLDELNLRGNLIRYSLTVDLCRALSYQRLTIACLLSSITATMDELAHVSNLEILGEDIEEVA